MKISAIINKFHSLGYELFLEGEKIRYRYTGNDNPSADVILPLLDLLKQNRVEAIAFLQQAEFESINERMAIQGENCSPDEVLPYVTHFNSLVIPFNSPARYKYWQGGQSPCDTLKELGRCDLLDKYRHPNSGN